MAVRVGVRGPGHLSRTAAAAASSEPAAATGEAGSAGTYFGQENWSNMFQTGAYTAALGADALVLGASQARRAIKLPANATLMPATGDFCLMIPFHVDIDGNSGGSARLQTLAGVDGAAVNSGAGGGIQISPGVAAGGLAVGEIAIQRTVGSAWRFWGTASNSPQVLTGAQVLGNRSYVMFVGAFGATSRMVICAVDPNPAYAMADRISKVSPIADTQVFSTTPTGTRTAVEFFNILGASGVSSGDRAGFAGAMADVAFFSLGFPSDAQCLAITRGELKISAVAAALGGGASQRYYNKLDHSARSGASLAAESGSTVTAAATLEGVNHCGSMPIRQGTGIGITLDDLLREFTFPLEAGATTGRAKAIGTCSLPGYPIYMRLLDKSTLLPLTGFDWTLVLASSPTGKYRVKLDGVPKSAKFVREVCLGNPGTSNHIIRSRRPCQFGYKAPTMSQSELITALGPSFVASTGAHSAAASGGHSVNPTQTLAGGGHWASITSHINQSGQAVWAHGPDLAVPVGRRLAAIRGSVGDLIVEAFNQMQADGNDCGLELITLGKSGHHIGATVFDDTVFNRDIAAHAGGTSYTGNIALDTATIRALFPALPSATTTATGWLNHIRPDDDFLITFGAVSVVMNSAVKDTGQTSENLYLSTDTGFTTPVGTVTLNAGTTGAVVTISNFGSSVPACTPHATWRTKQITATASYVLNTSWSNLSVKDIEIEALAPHIEYGFTDIIDLPGAANLYGTQVAALDDYGVQLGLFKDWIWGLIEAANPDLETALKNPRVSLFTKPRDTNSVHANVSATRSGLRRLAADSGDATYAQSWCRFGGDLYDNALDANSSPHSSYTHWGSARMGRHIGRGISAVLAGDPNFARGPRFGTPVLSGDSKTWNMPLSYIETGRTLSVATAWFFDEPSTDPDTTQTAGSSSALNNFYTGAGTAIDNSTTFRAALAGDSLSVNVTRIDGAAFTGTNLSTPPSYMTGGTSPPAIDSNTAGTSPPSGYLYDTSGTVGSKEPGRLAEPL